MVVLVNCAQLIHLRFIVPHQFGPWSNVSKNFPFWSGVPRQRVSVGCRNIKQKYECSNRWREAFSQTCSRTHHHPQHPPSFPSGQSRKSRRVVSRSSPDLKSDASRPFASICCKWKNGRKTYCVRWRQTARYLTSDDHFSGNGSRVLTHEHRREYCRTGTVTRRTHGGPICKVAGLLHVATCSGPARTAERAFSSCCRVKSCARIAAWLTHPARSFNSSFMFLLQFGRRIDVHRN